MSFVSRLNSTMRKVSVTFLGTSSGGGPTTGRNCASLVVDLQGNGKLWMVDCAEGTLRQIALQPAQAGEERVKASHIEKIFITHMHADHVMGLITLLRSLLYPVPNPALGPRPIKETPTVEIFGPAGIRNFVRMNMKMTFSMSADKYTVHELLTSACTPTSVAPEELHSSEHPGNDILSDSHGFWRDLTRGVNGSTVDAGGILHRDPCLAFMFRRHADEPEKCTTVAILGDTYDASPLIPLFCPSETNPLPPPDLLIHEATDAYIPLFLDNRATRSLEAVSQAALFRGHSTPPQAGAFAKAIGAKTLVLNHIGSRFPLADRDRMGERLARIREDVVREIEKQASDAWGGGHALCAEDFMRVEVVKSHQVDDEPDIPTAYNSRPWSRGNSNRRGDWGRDLRREHHTPHPSLYPSNHKRKRH